MDQKKLKKQSSRCKKSAVFAVSFCLLLNILITATNAFLLDHSDRVVNTFTPSKITTTVDEKLEGNTKSEVSIKNTGDTDAWIRAAVMITWQDIDGNIYGSKPVENVDYIIEWNLSQTPENEACWVKGSDGFYYWTGSVVPEKNTGILIKQCTYEKNKAPEGYSLAVEIVASGIQSKPASVFNTEWESSGLKVNETASLLEKRENQ